MKRCILFMLIGICLAGCKKDKFPYETGYFPEDFPINLLEINSEFDDMNSDYVPTHLTLEENFIFSSNMASKGGEFGLEVRLLVFNWDKETGSFSYIAQNGAGVQRNLRNQIFEINSKCNEKGPYSNLPPLGGAVLEYILFARDCGGVYKIIGSEFESDGSFAGYTANEFQVELFKGESNEMYPSFYGPNFLKGMESSPARPEMLLFTSDKDGQFDIYESPIPEGQSLLGFLGDSDPKTVRKLGLNTSSNDHMPFVYGDLLVFSSDRPGGYGGYDLYYSLKTADGWTDPVNFGPKINSEFDEYRPVVSDHPGFDNRLMIFSSNRPGGLGGFDLYFMGIPQF